APLLGLRRLTSAITETPSARKVGLGSRAGGCLAASSLSCSRLTRDCLSARSSAAPARISSSTVIALPFPPVGLGCELGSSLAPGPHPAAPALDFGTSSGHTPGLACVVSVTFLSMLELMTTNEPPAGPGPDQPDDSSTTPPPPGGDASYPPPPTGPASEEHT